MEISFVLLCTMLVASVIPVSAAAQPGIIESLLLATLQRPWLWGVYVFTVGLPIILFISFMWPDKRFGPPDQQYYYKKSDDAQPDDPEFSMRTESVDTKGKADRAVTRRRDTHGDQRKSDFDLKVRFNRQSEDSEGSLISVMTSGEESTTNSHEDAEQSHPARRIDDWIQCEHNNA